MTAVEWLIEQLQAPCRGIPSHIIEQAKEMEKQQIIAAYMADTFPASESDGEQYYKDTFETN